MTVQTTFTPEQFNRLMSEVERQAKAKALRDVADDIPAVYLRGDSPSAWLHRRANQIQEATDD